MDTDFEHFYDALKGLTKIIDIKHPVALRSVRECCAAMHALCLNFVNLTTIEELFGVFCEALLSQCPEISKAGFKCLKHLQKKYRSLITEKMVKYFFFWKYLLCFAVWLWWKFKTVIELVSLDLSVYMSAV